jgi:hypothetical protein
MRIKGKIRLQQDQGGTWDMQIEGRAKLLSDIVKMFGPVPGQEFELIIRLKPQYSTPLLGFYHGVVVPEITKGFIDEMGMYEATDEATDSFLRGRFLGMYAGKAKTFDDIEDPKKLNHFVNSCIIFAAQELHTVIQSPDENRRHNPGV